MRIAECELFMKGDFTLNVKDRPWKVFKAFGEDGLFQIKATSSGVDAIKLKDGLDKTIPYISRSANNNGIVDFIDDSNREFGIDERGNITIGLDTQTAFYQPHEFVTGQNIHIVSGDKINRYTAQFLVVILRNQMNAKFNWGGNGATLGRLKRLKIMLPVNSSGQPDYEFMEQYVSERERAQNAGRVSAVHIRVKTFLICLKRNGENTDSTRYSRSDPENVWRIVIRFWGTSRLWEHRTATTA